MMIMQCSVRAIVKPTRDSRFSLPKQSQSSRRRLTEMSFGEHKRGEVTGDKEDFWPRRLGSKR
jgi:hypothetical protein